MRALVAVLSILVVSCTSSGGGSTAPAGNFIYTSTGQCIDATTGNLAPSSLSCSTIPYNTDLFQLNTYNQCISKSINAVVDNRYCAAGAFAFQGLYCKDLVSGQFVDLDYCVPANLPYYTDSTGACHFSTTHNLVGSNIPCQRLANPVKSVCANTWLYSYYDGYFTPTYCRADSSNCRGSIMYVQTWGVPLACQ